MVIKNKVEVKDDPLFQEFILERNLSETSVKNYIGALQSYTTYHKLTLSKLIEEADIEEEQGVRAKNRKIIKRLKSYRTHLIQKGTESETIRGYYTKIKTFYRHNLIEIPYIPPVKLKQKQIMYDEIPHKEHIIEALEHTSNLKHKALIHFMASSGTARQETCNLTIQDFIDSTYEYHQTTNIELALEQLEKIDSVIPLFQITRQKTGYRHYTTTTPETVGHILRYLKQRGYKNLKPTDKLFDLKIRAINKIFTELNEKCKYPKGFLHPHSMRKYHADVVGDENLTNMLQGRKPNPIKEAYFKANPKRIKEEYLKHVEDLTLKPTKLITIESDEVKQLKREHKQEIKILEEKMKKQHDAEMRNFEEKMRKEMQEFLQEAKKYYK
jgi:hypothetical protein